MRHVCTFTRSSVAKRPALVLFLVITAALRVAAFEWPPEQVRFDLLSVQDGLPNSSISGIVQDPHGFMWFSTQAGLSRYDGYEFVTYEHDPSDTNSLSHNLIQTIYMDTDGTLWLGTYGGLNHFDPTTETFRVFEHDPNDPDSLSNNVVVAITRDAVGDLWVGTLNGLNRLNEADGTFDRYHPVPDDPQSLPAKVVRSLHVAEDGTLWVGSYGGLSRYLPARDGFETFAPVDGNPRSLPAPAVMTICDDPNDPNILWIGSWDGGVSAFDPRTGTARTIELPDSRVYAARFDRAGRLWVGSWGGGLMLVDPETGDTRRFPYGEREQVPHGVIYSLLEDDSGIMWIGTNGGGLAKYIDEHNRFRFVVNDPEAQSSLPAGKVYAIEEDRDGAVWCGVYSGGLSRIDPQTGAVTTYRHDPDDPASLSDDIVNAILHDSAGNLWIGTNEGLNRFVRETGDFERYHSATNAPWLPEDIIFQITETSDGRFWFGSNTGGASVYNPATGEYQIFAAESAPPTVSDPLVRDIVEDRDGRIWISTNNGLDRYDPRTGEMRHYRNDPERPDTLSSNNTRDVLVTSDGTVWIATSGGGANRYHPETDSFSSFSVKNGLVSNNVLAVTETEPGVLWFSTLRGISVYSRGTNRFSSVTAGTGLLTNELTGAALLTSGGELFVGSVAGITVIDRDDRAPSVSYDPPIVLTSFKVAATPVTPEQGADDSFEEISIEHADGFITAEFAALDFSNPSWNQYRYKLDGLDEKWTAAGTRNYLSYANLDPGEYTLRIRGAGSSGNWSSREIALPIRVLPPWWRSGWAYGVYVLAAAGVLVAAALYAAHRRRRAQAQMKKQLRINTELERMVHQRTAEIERARRDAETASEAKSRFLANMSHEIRTPVNGIMGMLSLLEKTGLSDDQRSYLAHSHLAAENLSMLVDDLLEFESIGDARLRLERTPFNVADTLRFVCNLLEPRAEAKRLSLGLSVDLVQDKRWVLGDQHRFVQIMSNLLSNAVKYTDSGTITVSATMDSGQGDGTPEYRFQVSDTGTGIPKESLDAIFDSFTQITSGYSKGGGGVGLGLAIVRQLVSAIGGSVSVESTLGQGSTFTVSLPLPITAEPEPQSGSPESTATDGLAKGRRVLVCEDEAINRLYVVRHLNALGIETDVAGTGPQAVEKAVTGSFDVILMDLGLPEFDGLEATGRIREHERSSGADRRTPIVALTAHSYATDVERCYQAGMDDFISKPIAERTLDDKIRTWMATEIDAQSDQEVPSH